MSSYLSTVNQKLLFARMLSDELACAGDNPHRQKSLVESVLFQLRLAFHFHLQEIAANYQCRQPALVADIAALTEQLSAINKWPSEAQEMQSLLDSQGTWLAGLLRAYDSCFVSNGGDSSQPSGSSTEFIAITQLPESEDRLEAGPEVVLSWLDALVEMIERHREGMFEC